MYVVMPLVVVLIDLFCHDVIGCPDLKVTVIVWLWFYCYFRSICCLLRSVISV